MADGKDPLFLQVKQAGPSAMEPYAGKSVFDNHGRQVVSGYRIMQPASDIFLGWTHAVEGNEFYFRQLRDMMISGYLGRRDTFDKALEQFAVAYADQNEKDLDVFKRAIKSGKIKAVYEKEEE